MTAESFVEGEPAVSRKGVLQRASCNK